MRKANEKSGLFNLYHCLLKPYSHTRLHVPVRLRQIVTLCVYKDVALTQRMGIEPILCVSVKLPILMLV